MQPHRGEITGSKLLKTARRMSKGLTVSNVAESQFRRYQKFPHWKPGQSQGHLTLGGEGHSAEYHFNLNNVSHRMHMAKVEAGTSEYNANISESSDTLYRPTQTETQCHPNIGHVSPRKWHHGYFKTGVIPITDKRLQHGNQVNIERGDLYKTLPMKIGQDKNQGEIKMHYNDLDFVNNLAIDRDDQQNINKDPTYKNEKLQTVSNTSEKIGTVCESKYLQLKKEYLARSRAKEQKYKEHPTTDCSCNDLIKIKSTRPVIRFDIEAPEKWGTFPTDIKPHVCKNEHPNLEEIRVDFKEHSTDKDGNINLLDKSSSITLPRFRNLRNTRFGSHNKITAYRPSTRLDNYRSKKLENLFKVQLNDIDAEEARDIWKEVDSITKEPLVPLSNLGKRLTNKSRDIHTSNNSVEFFPSFEKEHRSSNHAENNILNDALVDDKQISLETDARRHIPYPFKSAKDINLGKNELHTPLAYEQGTNFGSNKRMQGSSVYPKLGKVEKHSSYLVPQTSGLSVSNGLFLDKSGIMQPAYAAKCDDKDLTTQVSEDNYEPSMLVSQSRACKETKSRMTTTLPRITPANTPLPPGVCQSAPPRAHSSASMYGAYPPKDLSSSVDFLKMPGRVNPLAPPPPRKRINWSWETSNQHWENEKRRILMQKREHTRYHSAWSKAFYGAPAEKEAYRRHFREVLKQQMSDRENSRREELINKVKETERAVKYDEQCRSNDAQEYYRKHSYLMLYRDGNKQQMENKWAEHRFNKVSEDRIDRERLRYNPINWSCSLK